VKTVSDLVYREHYTFATVDERLRTCKARPKKRAVTTDNAIAGVLTDAFEYGDDCKSKLTATWKSIDDAKARADALNKGDN
jgi:hypothetical protein